MPKGVLAVVPLDFDLGFKLAGADTAGCASPVEAKGCVEKELAEPRYDLIIIDEQFLSSFDGRMNKRIRESLSPLVMALPLKKSFKKEAEGKDYFLKMVQSAIGYEIRIK